MNLGDYTVTINNQRVQVTEVEISYGIDSCDEISIRGRLMPQVVETVFSIGLYNVNEGNKMEVIPEEKDMICEQNKSLTEKMVDLKHDEDKQVLIRKGLMTSAGVLTPEGERFLLNMLVADNATKMAESVRAVEQASKE